MLSARTPGRIITFYSYKGGTGRTMSLANTAWLLASAGKKVLVIDWDLEAPGLHRYFPPFLIDQELASSDGLIDMVDCYASEAIRPLSGEGRPDPDWYLPFADYSNYLVSVNFDHFPREGRIDLLPAGRQSDKYAVTVSSFNWQNFFDRLGGGGFLEALKAKARAEYDYVLIDSRTGVSDTAGICSVQMPDTLVVCFTYNNQSIKGAAAVARSAVSMKRKLVEERMATSRVLSGDESFLGLDDAAQAFRVFPVPMRVVQDDAERLARRKVFARQEFSAMTGHLGAGHVAAYWSRVEVPHISYYAYEEVLAAFIDSPLDPKSLLGACIRLTGYLTDADVDSYTLPLTPEEKLGFLHAFAATPAATPSGSPRGTLEFETPEDSLARTAEFALALLSDGDLPIARRVLERLVRVGRPDEGGGYFPIRAPLSEFDSIEAQVIASLASARLVTVSNSPSTRMGSTLNAEPSVAFTDEHVIESWKRLTDWLDEDREFLIWQQQFRAAIRSWLRNGRDQGALLFGANLDEARDWIRKRNDRINPQELDYFERSKEADSRKTYLEQAAAAISLRSDEQALKARSSRIRMLQLLTAILTVGVAGILSYLLFQAKYDLHTALSSERANSATEAAQQVLPPSLPNASSIVRGSGAPNSAASSQVPGAETNTFSTAYLAEARALAPKMRLAIFWCRGSTSAARALAEQLRANLSDEMTFADVSIDELTPEQNAKPGYGIVGLQVRSDADSKDQLAVANAILATGAALTVASATGYAWRVVPWNLRSDNAAITTKAATNDAISLFLCPSSYW
jgi:MinD-like ATPase involved in chromosome partitioning or flagellar assembly